MPVVEEKEEASTGARKTADSDKLSRLFNVKSNKISTLEERNAHLNDTSIGKSHINIANDEMFN